MTPPPPHSAPETVAEWLEKIRAWQNEARAFDAGDAVGSFFAGIASSIARRSEPRLSENRRRAEGLARCWQTIERTVRGGISADLTTNVAVLPRYTEILTLDYVATKPGRLRIHLARSSMAAIVVYDSAFQTNPAPDATQYLTAVTVMVPAMRWCDPAMRLVIEKDAGPASARWRTHVNRSHVIAAEPIRGYR